MMGTMADAAEMIKAKVPRCHRCGTFLVECSPKKNEDECRNNYDGSDIRANLDLLPTATQTWINARMDSTLTRRNSTPWPKIANTVPSINHLPRATQFRLALATVLSKVALWSKHSSYRETAIKILTWLPRLVLTASPTARTTR